MSKLFYTVLGANGAVGQSVMQALQAKDLPVKAVSRNANFENIAFEQADLLNAEQTKQALKESAVVYLCIGLPYSAKVWQTQWEIIMQNVIEACVAHNAKLVFFDNIYMYEAPLPIPFDEKTRQTPISQKGIARKRTADLLLKAVKEGRIKGLIGRSADFYGPAAVNSPFYISFLERMLEGKAPQSIYPPKYKHTYANVTDLGRALVALSLCEDCYEEVWHLPVGEPTNSERMLTLFNEALETNFQLSVLPNLLRKILTFFIPPLKETEEMRYQFEQDYIMSFEKFQKRFPDFQLTSYEEGVNQMVNWFKRQKDTSLKTNL